MPVDDPYSRVGRAADELAETVWDSYRAIFDSALAAQERNVELTLHVFESGMESMERGVEINRRAALEVARRMREHREAYARVSQESTDAYSGFLGSLSDYYREVSGKDPEDADRP